MAQFFSPKGWDNIAQGEPVSGDALGHRFQILQPEGLGQRKLSQTFSLQVQPRASPETGSPWAMLSQPWAEEGLVVGKINCDCIPDRQEYAHPEVFHDDR